MTLDTTAMRTMLNLITPRCLLLAACSLALAACSGGAGDDSIRIGSGQTANSGTTGSADFPIFYVKRITPDMATAAMNNLDDVRRLRVFNTNADLYMRDRASTSAAEHNITARVHPANELWDVKDVDVSADGGKVIFAMRGPLQDDQKDKDPPNWGIWEYVIASDNLHRVVVKNDPDGSGGQYVSPHYLPDGHLIFSSTRQVDSKAMLLDEGKQQFEAQDENRKESAFALHVMDSDGDNIQQITFNQSHDMDPTVLSDGRVLFSRWDHAPGRNGSAAGGVHFYAANPDGTNTELLYGSASHNSIADTDANGATTYPAVQFTKPREMPDGRILTLVRPFADTEYGGDLYIIDTKAYVEENQAAVAGSGAAGVAATKATSRSVRLIKAPSPGGRFVSAAPLWDGTGRILAAWSQCRVIDPATSAAVPCANHLTDPTFVSAPPVYELWMFNPNGTQQPVVLPGSSWMLTDVVVAQPRNAPAFRPVSLAANTALDQTLRGERVGILDIRSVYDFDGVAGAMGTGCNIATDANPTSPTCYPNRPARFLRIEKAVSIPDKDLLDDLGLDFNLNDAAPFTGFLREIVGYIPIEPDGSVRVKVPGNVAFQISVVDTDGRRNAAFPRHNAWLTIRPGETVQCNGCHINSTNVPAGQSGRSHGRSGSAAAAYNGANADTVFSASLNTLLTGMHLTGQTMAQTRAEWSCSFDGCSSIKPSVDLLYNEVWMAGANPNIGVDARASVNFVPVSSRMYEGSEGLKTALPTLNACVTTGWFFNCRITIDYRDHIQPLWEVSRPVVDNMNNPVLDPVSGLQVDHQCTGCHNKNNAATQMELDARQLNLLSDPSDVNAAHFVSYRELLFDEDLELTTDANGVLITRLVQTGVDQNGVPIFTTVPISGRRLLARNAAGSSRFFSEFTSTGTHAGWLTAGELRLISEWVDIGAQYYNDPFKAPEN